MKNLNSVCLILFGVLMFVSCNNDVLQRKNADLQEQLSAKDAIIAQLRDSLDMVKIPASDRLKKINKLFKGNDLSNAEKEIADLIALFPQSDEAEQAKKVQGMLDNRKEEIRKEEERKKALGFKAIKETLAVEIGYNKMKFSQFVISNEFAHDRYDDRYFYNTADRGNSYINLVMSVESSDKDPNIPQLAVYRISDGQMSFVSTFKTCHYSWSDYSCYLGTYHDNRNDFAKTSTVKFSLGCEVSDDIIASSFAIVCKKENKLTRFEDRFRNPPIYYKTYDDKFYPQNLSIEDFSNSYIIVKLYNVK